MLNSRLVGLIAVFAPLSLFSFGGGQAIIADIQHQVVNERGWLTDPQFTDLFAVARASPGPTTLIAALIGWQVSSLMGAIVGTLAMYLPSSIVVFLATRWWIRNQGRPWCIAIGQGLAPVAIGLIFAGALAVIQAAHMDALGYVILAVATSVLYFTKLGPYILIGVVAALYAGLQFV